MKIGGASDVREETTCARTPAGSSPSSAHCSPCRLAAPARAAAPQQVTIDGAAGGRTFDGVGALSAGASSRLLIDYPEPQRGQILDYLFKPGYGAALQILKVEIGGDTNSTDGSEPSHMRTPSDLNCDRGYEWWLMEQAKAPQPPHQAVRAAVGRAAAGPAAARRARPCGRRGHRLPDLLAGLRRAAPPAHRLPGRLERGLLRLRLVRPAAPGPGRPRVRRHQGGRRRQLQLGRPGAARRPTPAFRAAVDVVGQHYVCGYLSDYLRCPSPAAAQALGKPLHASEQGSLPYDSGAAPLARALSRPYIDGAMTSTINWSLIASWYDTMPFQASGLMGADEPWSGAYDAGAEHLGHRAHHAVHRAGLALRRLGEGLPRRRRQLRRAARRPTRRLQPRRRDRGRDRAAAAEVLGGGRAAGPPGGGLVHGPVLRRTRGGGSSARGPYGPATR